MAANVIPDLDAQLASLNQLKAPGASKGKITAITQLCVNNIQVESNIVQSLYRALKKAPATHKLGAIYVIDSVVRRWIDQAKRDGQDVNIEGRGEPGTLPAAVKRVTELMPALFDDILKVIPGEQKEKLDGMIKIWEKSNTFPIKMLEEFRTKINAAAASASGQLKAGGDKFAAPVPSRPLYTPTGFPPQHLRERGFLPPQSMSSQTNGSAGMNGDPRIKPVAPQKQPPAVPSAPAPAPASNVNDILAALANVAPKPAPQPVAQPPPQAAPFQSSTPQQAPPPPQLPPQFAALFGQQSLGVPMQQQLPQNAFSPSQAMSAFQPPQAFPNFGAPQQPPSVAQQYPQAPPPPTQQPADPLAPLRSILPPNIINNQQKLMQALRLLQDLQKEGIPMEQWGPVIKALEMQDMPQPQPPAQLQAPMPTSYGSYNDYAGGRGRSRSRSRSPERGNRRGGRGSPVYGTYEESRQNDDDRRGNNARDRYRQRSPIPHSPTNDSGAPPKNVQFDNSLPPNHIKVLSRTLFVGGANGTQPEINALFSRFGRVQTCIANRDRRHAFVKMASRQWALDAKAGVERLQGANDRETMNVARQTKWGVGFGPRECCDYQRGESVIPLHKLTEADLKWILTAEYGGTGGQKVVAGMVVEEPDIEIGAGVSSKAMSRRVVAEDSRGGGKHGQPNSPARQRGGGGGGGRNNNHNNPNHDAIADAPSQAHSNSIPNNPAANNPAPPMSKRQRRREEHAAHHGHHGGHHHRDRDGNAAIAGGQGAFHQLPKPPHLQQQQQQQMEAYGYARPEPVAVATPPAVPGFGGGLGGLGGFR